MTDERQQTDPRESEQRAAEAPEVETQDSDVEGHMMPRSTPELARLRGADVEREMRQRQREKEARVNRREAR